MVTQPEEEQLPASLPLPESQDEEGGPVKTFLEHLEDLRWMIIKCVVALVVAMLVCLLGSNRLVSILVWPLDRAGLTVSQVAEVPLMLGSNVLGKLPVAALEFPVDLTNRSGALRLVTVPTGTNYLLMAQFDPGGGGLPSATPVLKNYNPLGGPIVALKLALYGGLILASPFLLFFIGQFVLPALKVTEKRVLYRAVAFGSVLFFLGVAFCYFLMASVALYAAVQFSQWMGFAADEWRAEEYMSFMCRFMFGMGLGFELPVVILVLVKIDLIHYQQLVRMRPYAVVGNLVLAALVTPPDPFTMVLMALPLQVLYEISVGVAWYWHRQERRLEAAESSA
ncbi:MAG: twin-arginine translocase subunit TatC [Verrucomicrobiae bacterium]|nr:twin-arginine translocase subunit TatC [Verrucomicrobiae bacterium]